MEGEAEDGRGSGGWKEKRRVEGRYEEEEKEQ